MCGFAGLVAWDERYRIDAAMLRRMGDAVAHRGPDQRVDLIQDFEGTQWAMSFSRLAILDTDPRAMQPMQEGQNHIVFNGEIYNFRELRIELDRINPGEGWKTTGDTEVFLRAFGQWREEVVEHLNGMFAMAIFDSELQTLFLARDRMGQKPLYLAVAPDQKAVAFASELAAIRALPWPDVSIDVQALSGYLQTGYIASPATIYRGIRKLPPATIMRCDGQSEPSPKIYFDPNAPARHPIDVKTSVLTAVRRQLVSDVPLGCFLSGGIDSSVIAAAMKQVAGNGQKVLTFSIGFDEAKYDETEYAAAVAKHLGTEHRRFIVRPDAATDLPKLATVFGEPFADSSALPTHYLARETRAHVKVALSGDGGDELFGGYDRYRAMRLARLAEKAPRPAKRLLASMPASDFKSPLAKLRRFGLSLDDPPARRYAKYVSLFDDAQIAALFPDAQLPNWVETVFQKVSGGPDDAAAAAATDRLTYLPEDLHTKVDRASMLHALEVRAPFMDHDLVAGCAGLSFEQMFRGGAKRLLRLAFADDLPSFVFKRKKMGFAVPIGAWLRGSLQPMLRDLLDARDSFAAKHFHRRALDAILREHMDGRVDHGQRLYGLLMLELWARA